MTPVREVTVTRPRAAWGRALAARPRLLQALGVVAVAWVLAYLVWRVGWGRRDASPVLWGALLAAELYGLWRLATFLWTAWSLPAVRRPEARTPRTVDVLVGVAGEDADLVRATLAGCAALGRPHATWVLDDDGRGEIAALAAEHDAGYLVRPGADRRRAGLLDLARARTDGELLFVLAAGEVPMPDALDAVAGWFEDPRVALVQTAHEASDQASAVRRRPGRHERSLFDGVVQPGAARHGAALWCGSAVMLRRAALEDVGGIATATTAEDLHTTLRLHAAGWSSRFHDEVLVQQLGRESLAAGLRERERRARGAVAILRTPESPLRRNGLRPAQRLSHLARFTAGLAGPARCLTLLVLAGMLWSGRLPMTPDPAAVLALWLPAVLLAAAAVSGLGRGYATLGDLTHREQLAAQLQVLAVGGVFRRRGPDFEPAADPAVDRGGAAALRRFALLDVLAVVLATGVAWRILAQAGVVPDWGHPPAWAAWLAVALGLVELRRLARTLRAVASRRELRRTRRVPVAGLAVVRRGTGPGARPPVTAKLLDLSPEGAGLLVPESLDVGEALTLTLTARESAARGVTHVHAHVARAVPREDGWWTVGVRLGGNPPEVRDRIAELCAIHAPMWRLRGAPQRQRPHHRRRAA